MHATPKFALLVLLALTSVPTLSSQQSEPAPDSCAALQRLSLPNVKILQADPIAAGAIPALPNTPPAETEALKLLPALCRVVALLTPSPDSDIKMELWMPVTGWNGKFRGQGNGGFAGVIDIPHIALSVSQGYASAGTDTGHTGSATDADWALNHPEKVIDFGYRGVHEMTRTSRSIIQAYYGSAPRHSYFSACSDGGREALMEAQRFPEDYDGILAGAPAYNWTALVTNAVFNSQALTLYPDSYIPPAKLPAISSAVVAACDAKDGITDGILNDPRTCHFKPSTLLCTSAETDKCLNSHQVKALEALYSGAHTADGKQIFPGYLPGAETGSGGWLPWITGPAPNKSLMFAFGHGYFSDIVFQQPEWNYKSATIDADFKAATERTAAALNSTNPNLKPFIQRGGKLILYHGWNDPAISALSTIDYFDKLIAVTGQTTVDSSVRLFMAPGMQHCGGGPGPDSFGQLGWRPELGPDNPQHDLYLALEQWVEKNTAPEQIIATKYSGDARKVTMTRPLCAYPKAAKYNGSGDINAAASFTCATAPK